MGWRHLRLRVGTAFAAAVAVAVAGCTSSSGKSGNSGGSPFEARPVIMPAQHTTAVRARPFASVQVPADEDAYNALSRSRQADLADALRGVDCAHPPTLSRAAVRVVCDAESYVYLLGAPIFTAGDVTLATPIAPSISTSTEWKVALSITSAAADKVYEWTSPHHVDALDGVYTVAQTSSTPPCGAAARTPCSDFLAYISDETVVTAPVTSDPFRNTALVSGGFSKAAATRLAHTITR